MTKQDFSIQDLTELTKASRELYYTGLMSIDEVRHFRKLLNRKAHL